MEFLKKWKNTGIEALNWSSMKGITRATKIVATLGPATDSPQKIEQLIAAGVDVVRLNFSHGTAKEHIQRASWVHEAAHRLERDVGVMVDLQGPK